VPQIGPGKSRRKSRCATGRAFQATKGWRRFTHLQNTKDSRSLQNVFGTKIKRKLLVCRSAEGKGADLRDYKLGRRKSPSQRQPVGANSTERERRPRCRPRYKKGLRKKVGERCTSLAEEPSRAPEEDLKDRISGEFLRGRRKNLRPHHHRRGGIDGALLRR